MAYIGASVNQKFFMPGEHGGPTMFEYYQIESLNELEMSVYSYVISHAEAVSRMKIRELADAVHVSTSTVLRFCSKMGCDQ